MARGKGAKVGKMGTSVVVSMIKIKKEREKERSLKRKEKGNSRITRQKKPEWEHQTDLHPHTPPPLTVGLRWTETGARKHYT